MADDKSKSTHHHDASDKKLDRESDFASDAVSKTDATHASGPTHDPAETRKHDDAGKDRLFEGRQQHDPAEKNSEKARLAKDIDHHHHEDGEVDKSALNGL
ncbi:MAG: hypothetical protein ABJE10_23885 [bacterium]